ncbi:MAG: STAS-like domain-containing protein [Chitinophagaceae bacterium]
MKKSPNSESLIRREGQELIFENLINPKVISDFIVVLNDNSTSHDRNLILNFKGVTGAFPNVCVPLAGITENMRTKGLEFEFYYLNEYLRKLHIKDPLRVQDNKELAQKASLDKVWRFDSAEEIYLLIDSFVDELSQIIVCEKGVLEGFEWSINEVLDNVLQHSGKNFGYVMGQVHPTSKHFVFCVYDTGQGIYNSLLNSVHKPKNPGDALILSVKEGVTRDKKVGQGNGLWGLHQIVSENIGKLNIVSNSAYYSLTNSKYRVFDRMPQLPYDNGCIVDFQLDYSREISISKALGGYEPTNLKLEALEDDAGAIIIDLHGKESGTGTRRSGEKLRTELINVYKQSGKSITLDFSKIKIVSSSFADELIGKLVTEFGFYGFNNIFKLKNMNSVVQTIVQRSVAQRMMESFNSKDHNSIENEIDSE